MKRNAIPAPAHLIMILMFTMFTILLVMMPATLHAQDETPEVTPDATITETSPEPTSEVTVEPTMEPTTEPTAEPTEEPTSEVTDEATQEATTEVTADATSEATEEATDEAGAETTPEATAGSANADAAPSAAEFISANPEDVAVVCYNPNDPDAGVYHQADEPFALASTFKLIILAEYAQQVDEGVLNPDQLIGLGRVDHYYLPGTDGGAHEAFLATLPEGTTSVTLSQIVQAMIQFSDNAAADYLLMRTSMHTYPELYIQLNLTQTNQPLLLSGLFLVLDNHEDGALTAEQIAAMDDAAFNEAYNRVVNLFLNDEGWYADEIEYKQESAASSANLSAEETQAMIDAQAAFFQRFGNRGSAHDMASAITNAYHEPTSRLTEPARRIMQQHLNWLMDANPDNRDVYSALGTKGGSYIGILTSAWYVQPIDGEPLVLSVLYRNLPLETWVDWLGVSGAHQQLELNALTTGAGCEVFAEALGQ